MLLNCQVEHTKLHDIRIIKSYMAIIESLKLHCRIREVVSGWKCMRLVKNLSESWSMMPLTKPSSRLNIKSCILLCCAELLRRVWLCDLIARQAPLSMGILWARILEWVAMPSSRGVFLTQGWNPGLLNCKQILCILRHQESPTYYS